MIVSTLFCWLFELVCEACGKAWVLNLAGVIEHEANCCLKYQDQVFIAYIRSFKGIYLVI